MTDYGATVDGVRGLLPERRIDGTSKPSEVQVEGYLADVTARVYARIGGDDVWTVTDVEQITQAAQALVHLGAAAYTEDAAHPERATPNGDTAYGATLWSRFLDGLEALYVALYGDERNPATAPTGGSIVAPAPLFSRDVRW